MVPRSRRQDAERPRTVKILFLWWLTFVLDLNCFPGLKWNKREDGTFFISWTHERSKTWRPEFARHCKAWSRFRGNRTQYNRNHKAGFRTTINSKVRSGRLEKLRTVKYEGKIWLHYRIIDRSPLWEKTNPFLLEYYEHLVPPGWSAFPSLNSSLFKKMQEKSHIPQSFFDDEIDDEFDQLESTQKGIQSSDTKRKKPRKIRKPREKKPKPVNPKQQPRNDGTSSTSTPYSSGNGLSYLESGNYSLTGDMTVQLTAVQSPLTYLMTPEPQSPDVVPKENASQSFHCLKDQDIHHKNLEYLPDTPMSFVSETTEIFSPSSSVVPCHSPVSCSGNQEEIPFYPSASKIADQNESYQPYYQLQPASYSQGGTFDGSNLQYPESCMSFQTDSSFVDSNAHCPSNQDLSSWKCTQESFHDPNLYKSQHQYLPQELMKSLETFIQHLPQEDMECLYRHFQHSLQENNELSDFFYS